MNKGMFFDHTTFGDLPENFLEDFNLHLKQKITAIPDWDFLIEKYELSEFKHSDVYIPQIGDNILIISLQSLIGIDNKLNKLMQNKNYKLSGVYGILLSNIMFNEIGFEFIENEHIFLISLEDREVSYSNTIKPILEINKFHKKPQIIKMHYDLLLEHNDFLVIIENHKFI